MEKAKENRFGTHNWPEPVAGNPEPAVDNRAWSALADMHQDMERQFEGVSKRIERLEKKTMTGGGDQLIDNRTIGMLIVITVIPIALQVVAAWLARRAAAEG